MCPSVQAGMIFMMLLWPVAIVSVIINGAFRPGRTYIHDVTHDVIVVSVMVNVSVSLGGMGIQDVTLASSFSLSYWLCVSQSRQECYTWWYSGVKLWCHSYTMCQSVQEGVIYMILFWHVALVSVKGNLLVSPGRNGVHDVTLACNCGVNNGLCVSPTRDEWYSWC